MNLRDLEYLLALYETHHFGQAAQQCHVSQPTLSGQLAKLEQSLGIQLVERTKRKVLFTHAGERIVERARAVQLSVAALQQEARQLKDPMQGELRVGIIPTVAPYLLPRIMMPLSRQCPDLTLLLQEAQTAVLLEKLERGQLDAVILALLPGMESFAQQHLYREPMLLAVSTEHAFASQTRLSMSALEAQQVLMLEDGHCLRDQALGYCFAAGAVEDGKFRATSLETLRHMVAAGHGVTLLPRLAVPAQAAPGQDILTTASSGFAGLRYIPLEDPEPGRDIVMLWRRGAGLSRCCREVASVITPAVAGELEQQG